MLKNLSKIVIRILLVSCYAMLILIVMFLTMPDDYEPDPQIRYYLLFLFYLLIFNLNTEGNILFDLYLNKKLPWFYFFRKRMFIQLAFIFLWTLLTIGGATTIWYFHNDRSLIYPPALVVVFIASISFLVIFIGISMTKSFFKNWKTSLLEIEHLKQEKLKADYKALQNQVNPHFLFNSLNVLIAEIKYAPDRAIEFTRKLSKVYRYVLQSKDYDLISLKQEIDFIESYIFLHKVRVGKALDFSYKISESAFQKQLPPLTLQILVENALKHNIADNRNALKIFIFSESENKLIVKNNLNPKKELNSTHTGLSNIRNRYELLKIEGLRIEKTTEEFIVTISLIDE